MFFLICGCGLDFGSAYLLLARGESTFLVGLFQSDSLLALAYVHFCNSDVL